MISIGIGTTVLLIYVVAQCFVFSSYAEDGFLAKLGRREVQRKSEDLTIVCTVDGVIHGIDKYGNKAWSTSTGKPMLSAQNYAAYDGGTGLNQEQDDFSTQSSGIDKRKGYSILPSTDGTLIYHSMDGMRKTSVTARLLVEQTPFVSGEGISFTGKKSSRLMKIDTSSGAILFDTEENNGAGRGASTAIDSNSSPIWIGRIDYALEAVDTVTGLQEFNFTYSELIPLPYGSQYQYGMSQEGRQALEHSDEPSEEFEVATDVELGEAEVVGLLGTRVAAAWSVDDPDEFPYAQESVVESEVDLVVESKPVSADHDNEASPRTRIGKVKRKRGRRRRKSRVSMEKRAATATKSSAVDSSLRQMELLEASGSALISTPDGELFFSDGDGTVVEKISLHLHSPVFSAFKLHRFLEDVASAVPVSDRALPLPSTAGGNAAGRWGVHSINVHHRVLTYPTELGDDTNQQKGLAVTSGDARPLDGKKIVVQSPFSLETEHDESLGHLYVLEVSELEMPGLRPTFVERDQENDNTGKSMLQSPYPTKRELRDRAKENRQPEPVGAVGHNIQQQNQEKEFPRKHLIRPGASIGSSGIGRRPLSTVQRRGKGLHGPAKLRLLDAEESDQKLPDGQSLNLGWLASQEQEGVLRAELMGNVEDICALRSPKFYYPVPWIQEANKTSINTCSMRPRRAINTIDFPNILPVDEDSFNVRGDLQPKKKKQELSNNGGMRGSHMLRPDLYEGTLFRSDPAMLGLDAQMHLFRGMLSSGQKAQKRFAAAEQSWEGWQDNPSGPASPALNLPTLSKPTHREWLDGFALRVFALVEHLLLILIAVAIVLALLFVVCVYFLRNSPAFSHMLPVGIGFSGQLHFAFHALVGRVLEKLTVVQDNSSKLHSPTALSVVTPLNSISNEVDLSARDAFLSTPSPAVFSITEGVSTHNVTTPVAISPAAAVNTAPLVHAAEDVVDADGRRLLRVGALLVHSDHILGYGSHGTTVYRGSLDGRPLAVKRILNQFVRSADREISLLIRSDGHANVVRYFTKEQKSDFVYLGLQLCDMTLKDFVVQVRSKSEAVGDTQISISEIVKMGLLQIAMGVAHLHAQRIVHRDIKPQNILLAQLNNSVAGNTIATHEEYVAHAPPASMDDLSLYVLKISDMGLSKQLGRDHHSFSSMSLSIAVGHSTAPMDPVDTRSELIGGGEELARSLALQAAVGTVGWQAPELISHRYYQQEACSPVSEFASGSGKNTLSSEEVVLIEQQEDDADSDASEDNDHIPAVSVLRQMRKERKKRTLTVDIFSLGCVFYFTITRGEHPFGQWFEREANIAAGKMNLDAIKHDPLAVDLLTWMLTADPLLRPTSSEVCGHPFFWTATSKLNFLVEFSDRMEHEPADSNMVLAVEAGGVAVHGGRWDRRLDVLLLEDLGKFRKYDTSSVRDLLRVIRNKRHHFHELSAPLKEAIGSVPENFMSYFDVRFPHLVLHCAYVAHRYLSDESLFRPWVRGTRSCSAGPVLSLSVPESNSQLDVSSDTTHSISGLVGTDGGIATRMVEHNDCDGNRQIVDNVVVWQNSALANTLQCGGWWRNASDWVTAGTDSGAAKKNRASHLTKSASDPKYRISLCTHWEDTQAAICPMRKKGKCVFAHGPLELRVKEARRNKWGQSFSSVSDLSFSGGEDVFGAARNTLRSRQGFEQDSTKGKSVELKTESPSRPHMVADEVQSSMSYLSGESAKDISLGTPGRQGRPAVNHQPPSFSRRHGEHHPHQQLPFVPSSNYNQQQPYHYSLQHQHQQQQAYLHQVYLAQQQGAYFNHSTPVNEPDGHSSAPHQQYNRYPSS